jgi:excisionase family DNA binding protein
MAQTIAGVEYLDVAEATALLGVKRATLYAYVSRGVLQSYRMGVGRARLYRRDEVEALRAVRPSDASRSDERHGPKGEEGRGRQGGSVPDDVFRDVRLPDAADWAPDH